MTGLEGLPAYRKYDILGHCFRYRVPSPMDMVTQLVTDKTSHQQDDMNQKDCFTNGGPVKQAGQRLRDTFRSM